MDRNLATVWFTLLGILFIFALVGSIGFLGSHNYYQEQHYNNLPSLNQFTEPVAMQEYKEAVQEANTQTEQHITNQNMSDNSTGVDNLFSEEVSLIANSPFFYISWVLTSFMVYTGILPRPFNGRRDIITSVILGFFLAVLIVCIYEKVFLINTFSYP
jgi:hypothetical protein